MTKGDRDKLRAELAGRCVAALILADHRVGASPIYRHEHVIVSVEYADALMDRLGLSEASEQAEIAREAERRRGGV